MSEKCRWGFSFDTVGATCYHQKFGNDACLLLIVPVV